MGAYQLQVDETGQVDLELGVAEPVASRTWRRVNAPGRARSPHRRDAAATIPSSISSTRASGAAARRGTAEHLVGEAVGKGHVPAARLDVGDRLPVDAVADFRGRWCWWSNAMARMSVRYFMWSRLVRVRPSGSEARGEGVDDGKRFDQPLGVLVELEDTVALGVGDNPSSVWASAGAVDGPGLGAVLVDAEHDAAVEQLLVDVDGRRGQE